MSPSSHRDDAEREYIRAALRLLRNYIAAADGFKPVSKSEALELAEEMLWRAP